MAFQVFRSNKILTGILIVIIVGTTISFAILNGEEDFVPENYIADITSQSNQYLNGFDADLIINTNASYKGELIPATLEVLIENSQIWIGYLDVEISFNARSATQRILLNESLSLGQFNITFDISPGFDNAGFIALTYGNYEFTGFTVHYLQRYEELSLSKTISSPLDVLYWPEFNQFSSLDWNESSTNVEIVYSPGIPATITFNPLASNGTARLQANITTVGYTSLDVNYSTFIQSSVSLRLNNTGISSSGVNSSIFVGALTKSYILIIDVNITGSESLTLELSMITRQTPVFAVIANNNWEGLATDGLVFNFPNYYLNQVSIRYTAIFNISLIQVSLVNFNSKANTDLFKLRDEAMSAVGVELELANNTWGFAPGPQSSNFGADILLVFTNRTMDHLGIVFGDGQSAFNIAINARGSNFDGNYRILSTMADNLLQHEISHIFGAPDRWTSDDPASIMSKSKPADAYLDFVTGRFWLLKTSWLAQDIRTMIETSNIFL